MGFIGFIFGILDGIFSVGEFVFEFFFMNIFFLGGGGGVVE